MQGWAKFYDFNFSQFRSGMDVVEQGRQASWKELRGLLGTAIYGGVVDNAHDTQVTVVCDG